MESRRPGIRLRDVARGPGRLTSAMGIGYEDDGIDLCGSAHLWLGTQRALRPRVGESVRIGLTKGVEERLRFFVHGSRFLSGPRRLNG